MLPVEMFFPVREYPTPALEGALAQLGVVCRPLPEVDLPRSNATDTETDLSGFTMKVAALLLSRFQEVSHSCMQLAPPLALLFVPRDSLHATLSHTTSWWHAMHCVHLHFPLLPLLMTAGTMQKGIAQAPSWTLDIVMLPEPEFAGLLLDQGISVK